MASDAVDRIKERVSILDVVAPYVELHKAGKSYKGKSPFTSEKTPSFFVSPDRGMYYCFSTSKGGDAFTFIQEMEGVDFKGALKILAEKAGVELVPEDPKKRSERDALYAMLESATLFYQSKLQTNDEARSYLEQRGVKSETIAAWRLGYAPGPPQAGWRELGTELESKNYQAGAAIKAGLLKRSEQGKEPYDVFRDRVMFPISDPSGRVIAFSGRILSKDSEAPKYVNSPETELFNKSEALYGYDKAKQGIRKFDFSLIVEGQFDVVLAHQAGYTNTVAVSGTAMTDYHVGLLQRLSNRVVLALDADRAGIAAIKRAADVLLARGADVKVARIPDGQDPADIIQADPKRFKELIGQSTHVIEFLLDVLKAEAKDERTFKLRARDEIIPFLLRIQNHIDRDHFEAVIADALSTTKEAVHLEVSRLLEEKKPVATEQPQATQPEVQKQPDSVQTRETELTVYLTAALGVVPAALKAKLQAAIAALPVGSDAEVPAELVSKVTFTLESSLADLEERYIKAELNDKLHEVRQLRLRTAITVKKEGLYAAERNGETTDLLLTDVTELQRQLAAANTPVDYFVDESEKED